MCIRDRPRTNRRVDVADYVPTVYLDAGLAFGSGTHPTTRLCLEWLEANANRAPKSFLDYGCGSGILALAAAAMGNSGCAVDNDNQAIDSAVSNRDFNQIDADRLSILSVSDWQIKKNSLLGSFDFVIANIMMKTLIDKLDLKGDECLEMQLKNKLFAIGVEAEMESLGINSNRLKLEISHVVENGAFI